MRHRLYALEIAVVVMMVLSLAGCHRKSIALKRSSGTEASDFRLHDSLHFEAERLSPRSAYEIQVVRDDGVVVSDSVLSTDVRGRIPESVLWYDIGVKPCGKDLAADAVLLGSEIVDTGHAGRYRVRIVDGGKLVREAPFRVEAKTGPRVYAADSRGCPKTGFLIGEDDVWVFGRDLPKGSLVRVWAVPDDWHWKDAAPLRDVTAQYAGMPPLIELGEEETEFKRLLWPKGRTSVGSYDIVAEVITYPFGQYHAQPTAEALNLVDNLSYSGFVVQRRPGVGRPIEQDAAGVRQSKLVFRNSFLTTENVFVGVDPYVHPPYIGKSAKVYIVAHKTDAQWTLDPSLTDVTGYVEQVTIQPGGCANCYSTLAWAAPLTPGKYDVVLDFNMDGVYTPGQDLIDALDEVGFHVAEVRVDTISFNYSGSGAITIFDNGAAANVASPEYTISSSSVRPAAWTMGGSHTIQATFKAVPTVTSARIWAENGLGGLNAPASPVTVTFSGGAGQASFTVNTTPAYVGQHLFDWDWKYRDLNGAPSAPLDMDRTGKHTLFTVLATPQAPQAVPWLEALEIATNLANGRNNAADAVRDIWQDFYLNVGALYDVYGGAPKYTGATTANFNLTMWLADYKTAAVGTVNCYDMGKVVVVFANAIGAGTEYVYVSPFGHLNCVKPIGRGWANNPFYDNPSCPGGPIVSGDTARCGFGNHGFSRLNADKIYDGSGGQVDVDSDPDDCPPTTPLDLAGYDSWLNNYRGKVIDFNPSSNPGSPVSYAFGVY